MYRAFVRLPSKGLRLAAVETDAVEDRGIVLAVAGVLVVAGDAALGQLDQVGDEIRLRHVAVTGLLAGDELVDRDQGDEVLGRHELHAGRLLVAGPQGRVVAAVVAHLVEHRPSHQVFGRDGLVPGLPLEGLADGLLLTLDLHRPEPGEPVADLGIAGEEQHLPLAGRADLQGEGETGVVGLVVELEREGGRGLGPVVVDRAPAVVRWEIDDRRQRGDDRAHAARRKGLRPQGPEQPPELADLFGLPLHLLLVRVDDHLPIAEDAEMKHVIHRGHDDQVLALRRDVAVRFQRGHQTE